MYGMDVMLLFQKISKKLNGNCELHLCHWKKRWMINRYCSLQPFKLVFPGHPDMCYSLFLFKPIMQARLTLVFTLSNKGHLPLNVVFAIKNLLY